MTPGAQKWLEMTSCVSITLAQDKMVALASLGRTTKLFWMGRFKGPSILGTSGGPLGVFGALYFGYISSGHISDHFKRKLGPLEPLRPHIGPIIQNYIFGQNEALAAPEMVKGESPLPLGVSIPKLSLKK